MPKTEYAKKLLDPRWQKKRLEILERDGWKCACCSDKKSTLHIHHIFYLPKKDPWEIPNGLLITLCEDCHIPAQCDYEKCEECPDFKTECFGSVNIPNQIIDSISTLLNSIWEKDIYKSCVDNLDYESNKIIGGDR